MSFRKLKKNTFKFILSIRRLNAIDRVTPDFIIVGAQKAGTTSLFRYLATHPNIKAPFKTKEIHFFDGGLDEVDNYKKGLSWYKSHFPKKSKMENKITFEASPLYLFHPEAPFRIKKVLPDVKIIILLRNPIDRTISHYFHEKRKNREKLPIEEALKYEESRIEKSLKNNDYKSKEFLRYTYKTRSKYYYQIKRYLDLFPEKNILILKSENLFNHPIETLNKVQNFLNIDSFNSFDNLTAKNVGNYNANLPSGLYDYLENYFKPFNLKLKMLIGEEFKW